MISVLKTVGARLGAAALVVWATATVVFFALRLTGDPLEAVLGGPGSQASAEAVARARERYGFDRPLVVQYLSQLWQTATLQFGDSYARKQPVTDLLWANLPPTVLIASLAFVTAWVLVLLGTLLTAAAGRGKRGARVRSVLSGIDTATSVTPQFFTGAVLILLFSTTLGLLPATSGSGPAGLVLPVITLALPVAGYLSHVLRASLEEADRAPFALTSRARGAGEARLLFRHTLRHAALPALALSGWAYGSLLSGAVIVEALFARQGLGRLLLEAATTRDVPVVVGAVTVIAILYVAVMLLTDLIERILVPVPAALPAEAAEAIA